MEVVFYFAEKVLTFSDQERGEFETFAGYIETLMLKINLCA